jgi:hypothetical protein
VEVDIETLWGKCAVGGSLGEWRWKSGMLEGWMECEIFEGREKLVCGLFLGVERAWVGGMREADRVMRWVRNVMRVPLWDGEIDCSHELNFVS